MATRMRLPPESDIRLSRKFSLNWRSMWVASALVLIALIAVVSSMLGVFGSGLLLILLIAVVTGILLFPYDGQHSLVTWIFNKAKADLGENVYSTDDHKRVDSLTGGGRRKHRYPKRLGKIDFQALRVQAGDLGIARDERYGTVSFTVRATSTSLMMADELARLNRLEAFAHLLDRWSEPTNPVCRFSWQVQTVLGKMIDPNSFISRVREDAGFRPSPLLDPQELSASMEALASNSWENIVTFTVTLDCDAVSSDRLKRLGGIEGVVLAEAKEFSRALRLDQPMFSLGLSSAYFLNYNALLLENRRALDPVFGHPYIERLGDVDPGFVYSTQRPAWPGFFDFSSADFARAGSTCHIGHYLSDTPSRGVTNDHLKSLLNLKAPKTVTVVYHMLPRRQAIKRAEMVANAATATMRERQDSGIRVTSSDRYHALEVEEHEELIASATGSDGRARMYVTSYGSTPSEARHSADVVVGAALDSGLKLEPLAGRHADAVEVLMPLGRGLVTPPLRR